MKFYIKNEKNQQRDIKYLSKIRYLNQDKYFHELQLTNKVGATTYEEVMEADRYFSQLRKNELDKEPLTGVFDIERLKSTHAFLFQDIYYFAGALRDINMQIDPSTIFEQPQTIEKRLNDLFFGLEKEKYLQNLNKSQFCERFSAVWTEYIRIHPFREGNGRTGRVFFGELAKQAGWKLDWKKVPHTEWVLADECAFDSKRDYGKADTSYLQNLLDRAITQVGVAEVKPKRPTVKNYTLEEMVANMPDIEPAKKQKINNSDMGNEN